MLVISNNLIGKIDIPAEAVIRLNLAWIDVETAKKIIKSSTHDIYLDYPRGRTKPPKPKIKIDDAVRLTNYPQVKYFAVSNIETPDDIFDIIDSIGDVEFVPKIETPLGVKNIYKMIACGIKTIMVDKEDLYTSVNCSAYRYEKLLAEIRKYRGKIRMLELHGVVFYG